MVLFTLKGKKCILYQHQHPHLGLHVRGPYVRRLVYLQQDVIFVIKKNKKPLSNEVKSDHKNILYKTEVLQLLCGKIHRRICSKFIDLFYDHKWAGRRSQPTVITHSDDRSFILTCAFIISRVVRKEHVNFMQPLEDSVQNCPMSLPFCTYATMATGIGWTASKQ